MSNLAPQLTRALADMPALGCSTVQVPLMAEIGGPVPEIIRVVQEKVTLRA
jgi:hypothetical protein